MPLCLSSLLCTAGALPAFWKTKSSNTGVSLLCDSYQSRSICNTLRCFSLRKFPIHGALLSCDIGTCSGPAKALGTRCAMCHHFLLTHEPYLSLSPQVLGFTLIILYTSSVSVTLWRIHQGVPQAPEFLIHPTVWLTTMVRTPQACWLAPG